LSIWDYVFKTNTKYLEHYAKEEVDYYATRGRILNKSNTDKHTKYPVEKIAEKSKTA
jgi:hypothetical protein